MRLCTVTEGKISFEDTKASFVREYNVIVAGMGTAGIFAALCAAEQGLKVLGIESLGGVGGIGTLGCVWDYYFGSPGGRFEAIDKEILSMLESERYLRSEPINSENDYRCYPGLLREYFSYRDCKKANLDMELSSTVCGVYIESGKIEGLKYIKNGKEISVKCNVCIDCTGGALISRMAGLPLYNGRNFDGIPMKYSKTMGILQNGLARGVWTICGYANKKNAYTLSKEIVIHNTEHPCMRNKFDDNNRVIFEGQILGLRESARAYTVEALSFEDFENDIVTDKPVIYSFTPLDNVNRDLAFESKGQQDWNMICNLYDYGYTAAIPMGALIVKDIDGLLVAGKNIGIDHDMATGIRMKKDIQKCAEAAAYIAYLSVKHNCRTCDISYSELEVLLKKSGCLSEDNNVGYGDLRYKERGHYKHVKLFADAEEIKSAFCSEEPYIALWSVKFLEKSYIVPFLLRWVQSDNERLFQYSAIALGVIDEECAIPYLEEMLEGRPDIFKGTDIKIKHPNALRALTLLGRYKKERHLELYFEVLERKKDYLKNISTANYKLDKSELDLMMMSAALMNIYELAKSKESLKDGIINRLNLIRNTSPFKATDSISSEIGKILRKLTT